MGQCIHRKGFDLLINAARCLEGNVGIYIVGGEPTNSYIKLKQSLKLDSVYFAGFKTKDELSQYYDAADLFAHPTREDIWGLVINEAMAYGSVISTNRCIAATELIGPDQDGAIFPADDYKRLEKAINEWMK